MQSVMLIGAMKSGTTTLYNLLIQHPEICGCVSKEPEYFSQKMGYARFKKGRYEELFDMDNSKHKFILDASTGYTKYPSEIGVANRIKEYGLNPFFIYIVRDPLERIVSHYNFMKSDKNWKGKMTSPHLVHVSMYYTQLQEYTKVFPKERILVLDFDLLKKNSSAVCKKIFDFIGASKFDIESLKEVRKNKTKPTNQNKLKIEGKLTGYGHYFPPLIKQTVRKSLSIIFPARERVLSPKEKEKFRALLATDMAALQEHFDVNIEKWGF